MKLIPKLNIDFGIKEFFISIHSILSNRKEKAENNIYYLNHARTGITLALSSFNLSAGSKVGMTAYNCDTVMQAIKQAGFEIVFLDITDDLFVDLDDLNRKANRIDALIVSHLFGIVNDMEQITKICPSIPIIEDCAHAFLSANEIHKAGEKGDIAVFSIGLGKFPSISEGGVLKVNNEKYTINIRNRYKSLGSYSIYQEIKLLIKNTLFSIAYKPIIYAYVTYRFKQKRGAKKPLSGFNEFQMSKQSYNLYKKKEIFFEKYKDIQRNNLLFFIREKIKCSYVQIPNYPFGLINGFMLPLLIEDRREFLKRIRDDNLEITTHFADAILWAQSFGYKLGDCENSEKIANTNIVIPTYYKLNHKILESINIC